VPTGENDATIFVVKVETHVVVVAVPESDAVDSRGSH
jgi:hypothetical protein